jgi:integrase
MGNFWTLRIWRDEYIDGKMVRKRVRERLADATVSFRQAQKLAAEKLRPLNQGLTTLGAGIAFSAYVDEVYRATDMPLMAQSTRIRTEGVLKNHLLPVFGGRLLCDMTPLAIQKFLSSMAKSPLAHESRDKIRDVLSSVLGSAKTYGLLTMNPAEGLRVPQGRATPKLKPTITVAQFNALMEIIAEPYASMVFVSVWTGLRISELVALRWADIHEQSITVDEKYCRGEWGEPKSESSKATIPVLPMVIDRIHRLKGLSVRVGGGRGGFQTYKLVKSCGANDLVFQSVRTGAVMRDNNILTRHIIPAAKKLNLQGVNWLCLRRSHATWMKRAGISLKDASTQMRHSRTSITADIYEMTTAEDQVLAISKLGLIADGSKMVN